MIVSYISVIILCLNPSFFSIAPSPMFEFPMYVVPEGDPGSVPLCVDISVEITEPITYTITTGHKSPPEAEGKEDELVYDVK